MKGLRADEIIQATGGRLLAGDPDTIIRSISTDSRSIKAGEVFIALCGERFDGHRFIGEAVEKGADGIIISDDSTLDRLKDTPLIIIKVGDTLKALADLGRYYRDKFQVRVIAITGSNGKTTTKEMMAKILRQKFKVLASPKSFNNAIGLPLSLLGLEDDHEFAIVEMGISRPGEMERLVQIARPEIGVITNIGDSHLEYLGNRQGVAQAKFKLFEKMQEGIAILNQDDPLIVTMGKELKMERITFGIKEEADVMASNIQNLGLGGIRFNLKVRMEGGEETMEIRLPLLGEHNVYNALACGAIIKALNLDLSLVPEGLSDFEALPSRMRLFEIGGIKLIDDTYNANPNSMFGSIQTLVNLPVEGRRICVLGDMLELGQAARLFHMKLGEKVAEMKIDLLFTVGELTKISAEEAIRAGLAKENVFISEDTGEALNRLRPILKEGDLLLVKGSRRMGMERIIEGLKRDSN